MITILIILNVGLIAAIVWGVSVLKKTKVFGVGLNELDLMNYNNLLRELLSKVEVLTKATKQTEFAILGQNKAVSDLTKAFNLNRTNILARLDKMHKDTLTEARINGIVKDAVTAAL